MACVAAEAAKEDRVQGELLPNGVAVVTIHRPQALNAADEAMVVAMHKLLDGYAHDPACRAVLLEGSAARAFCSGGDVKAIAQADDRRAAAAAALGAEYQLICAIANMTKPVISLMEGVVMGFGLGISGHGRYRVVTENTNVAMPENSIGLLPDVGFAHMCLRAPEALGLYMALTGARVQHPADLLHMHIGTHFTPSSELPELREALLKVELPEGGEHEAVEAVLLAYAADAAGPGPLAMHQPSIQRCFSGKPDVSAIVQALKSEVEDAQEDGRQPEKVLAMLQGGSPTTLSVTHRHYANVAADQSSKLEDVLKAEFGICVRIINETPEFLEGVRAALIDKDRTPKWLPPSLTKIESEMMDAIFAPLDKLIEEKWFHSRTF